MRIPISINSNSDVSILPDSTSHTEACDFIAMLISNNCQRLFGGQMDGRRNGSWAIEDDVDPALFGMCIIRRVARS